MSAPPATRHPRPDGRGVLHGLRRLVRETISLLFDPGQCTCPLHRGPAAATSWRQCPMHALPAERDRP